MWILEGFDVFSFTAIDVKVETEEVVNVEDVNVVKEVLEETVHYGLRVCYKTSFQFFLALIVDF